MTQSGKSPEGQVADAVKDNWVDRNAPRGRPPPFAPVASRPPYWHLAALYPLHLGHPFSGAPGTEISGPGMCGLILGCGAGAWLMRGAGCTWNDITDRKFDAQVARTRSRPIPSGQVTVRGALLWMVAQALIAFCILISFGTPAVLIGIASLGFVAIYPFAKRFTWWPQVFLGLAFNWGALLGWVAHSGRLRLARRAAVSCGHCLDPVL